MSSYLVPAKPIENLEEALQSNFDYNKSQEYFLPFLKNPVQNPSNVAILMDYLKNSPKVYDQNIFPENVRSGSYLWQQNEQFLITITLSLQNKDNIEITNTSISGVTISGNFYSEVSSFSIENTDTKIIVTLQATSKWPVLIVSGNLDSCSALILSNVADDLGNSDLSTNFQVFAASTYNAVALSTISLSYRRLQPNYSYYWLVNSFLRYSKLIKEDPEANKAAIKESAISNILLSAFLLSQNDVNSIHLAENLLIFMAKNQMASGFFYLGRLHLEGHADFQNNQMLGIKYLEEAAKLKHLSAIELLRDCYSKGIAVEANPQKVEELNSIIDNIETGAAIKEQVREIEKEEEKGSSFMPVALACASVASAVGLLYFLVKRKKH